MTLQNRKSKSSRSSRKPRPKRASDEEWFEYRLEHHPEFLRRIAEAREAVRAGRAVPLADVG